MRERRPLAWYCQNGGLTATSLPRVSLWHAGPRRWQFVGLDYWHRPGPIGHVYATRGQAMGDLPTIERAGWGSDLGAPPPPGFTDQPVAGEIERAEDARVWVHGATCPRGLLDPAPCQACPTVSGLLLALRVLDVRTRDARGARRALHDVVCCSGCGPESDHADRTQARVVAALRKFHAADPTP